MGGEGSTGCGLGVDALVKLLETEGPPGDIWMNGGRKL